jgi:hypothetical protein
MALLATEDFPKIRMFGKRHRNPLGERMVSRAEPKRNRVEPLEVDPGPDVATVGKLLEAYGKINLRASRWLTRPESVILIPKSASLTPNTQGKSPAR